MATVLKEELPQFFADECSLSLGTFVSILYVEVLESGTRANVFVSIFPDAEKRRLLKSFS